MSSYNQFSIKRQAHALSRRGSGARFNPFAHLGRGNKPRRNTFTADVERGLDGDGIIRAVTHAATATPEMLTGAERGDRRRNGDDGVDASARAGSGSGSGSGNALREDGQDAFIDKEQLELQHHSSAHSSSTEGGLRNRRPDQPPPLVTTGLGAAVAAAAAATGTAGADVDSTGDAVGGAKKKGSKFIRHIEPKEPLTVANQLQRIFLNSWVNVLLVAAPAGIALHYAPGVSPIAVFVVNFVAIVPLAAMLGFATEEIALRTGETLGGLLNATFGNAVELIVAIVALLDGQVIIVRTSLIGSILSNLLLVLGMCFFLGGLRRQEQFFNTTVAQTAASLLALAVAGAIVPTVFDRTTQTPNVDVAMLSRGTSVILLVVYAAYLFFQLHTHHAVFSEQSQKVPAKPFRSGGGGNGGSLDTANHGIGEGLAGPARRFVATGISPSTQTGRDQLARMLLRNPVPTGAKTGHEENGDDDADEEPQLHFFVALGLLLGSTVVIAFCAEFLVDSIDYVTTAGGISKEFLGLILLPIVGNATEHATAVTVAIKDKMDLAIGVAIGSSMQVALFLIPLLVIIGWGRGMDNMSLSFDVFQVAVLFVSVLLVNYLIADGKSHWLEGFLLICLYAIIAVCSWWYPVDENGQPASENRFLPSHF